MRTVTLIVAVTAIVLLVSGLPGRSQEQQRIGAMIDVTTITKKLDEATQVLKDLKQQNEELKAAAKESNEALALLAAGTGLPDKGFIARPPTRWEYKFVHSRSEELANKQGAQGWELVNIFEDKWFIYRRPLPPRKEVEE
jgi:hypothetical protein